jgi:hypothetical protein
MTINDPNLLWGKTGEITLPMPANSPPVQLTLDHLFSRVRVEASTAQIVSPDVYINEVGGAFVSPSYSSLVLNAAEGKLTPNNLNSPENQLTKLEEWREAGSSTAWLAPNALNFKDVESNYCYIYTHEVDTVALFITNLNVDNENLGGYQFRFTKALVPGISYKLTLNFQRQIWPGSNIFWDGTKLTFLPENTPQSGQGYQGVYFKWGSLIGISPLGNFNNSTTKLYVPQIGSSNWAVQYAAGPNSWTGTSVTAIPAITGGTLVSPNWLDNHTSRNYLSAAEAHTPNTFKGDICKYLTDIGAAPQGTWRMPNAREFGMFTNEYTTSDFRNIPVGGFAALEDGTFDLYNLPALQRSFAIKNASSTVFPDGLSRNAAGIIDQPTRYFSGSPTSITTNKNDLNACFNLFIAASLSFTTDPTELGYQGLVRCIKMDGGGKITWIIPTVDVEDWIVVGTPFGQGDTNGQGNVQY